MPCPFPSISATSQPSAWPTPTRHPYGLALWQSHIEAILARWVDELRVKIHRGREVTGFKQDDTGVDVQVSDGQLLRADYLVGCDGGRSLVRKEAGIEFPGSDPTTSNLIAQVELVEEPEWGIRQDAPFRTSRPTSEHLQFPYYPPFPLKRLRLD